MYMFLYALTLTRRDLGNDKIHCFSQYLLLLQQKNHLLIQVYEKNENSVAVVVACNSDRKKYLDDPILRKSL